MTEEQVYESNVAINWLLLQIKSRQVRPKVEEPTYTETRRVVM